MPSANTDFIIPQLLTDFNVAPYYDDFDPHKNYKRILSVPSLALQSRDVTQMQTMVQYDQAVYMSHFFKDGAKIKGGHFKIDLDAKYVRIKDVNNFSNTVNVDNFLETVITGGDTDVQAYVIAVEDGAQDDYPDTKTLIIKYTKTGTDSANTFSTDEVLTANNDFTCVTLTANNVGDSSIFSITEGYLFARGFPVYFEKQSIVLDKYSRFPTCKVGFNIVETIVTPNEDATLNDPAARYA